MPTPDGAVAGRKTCSLAIPAAAAAALTLSMSICTNFSPWYLTGPTQTTGASETIAPPIIACLKYQSGTSDAGRRRLLMSALPSKADADHHGRNVRFVPKADIATMRAHRVVHGDQVL